jgi:hypothetical protein
MKTDFGKSSGSCRFEQKNKESHGAALLMVPLKLTILLLDQAPGEKQADDQEAHAYGSP